MTDRAFQEKRSLIQAMSPARAATYYLRHQSIIDSRKMPGAFRRTATLILFAAIASMLLTPFPEISPVFAIGFLGTFSLLTALFAVTDSRPIRDDRPFRAWLFLEMVAFCVVGVIGFWLAWALFAAITGGSLFGSILTAVGSSADPTSVGSIVFVALFATGCAVGWIGLFVQKRTDARKEAPGAPDRS